MTFAFYDLETTGIDLAFDQPLQFAAILTDDDFEEIERANIRCRLAPHILPSPYAMEVTGVTPENLSDLFNVRREDVDPDEYEFLILATPVIYYKLLITDWVRRNLSKLDGKPVVMVTVSGAPTGTKLDAWIGDSLPTDFVANAKHVALHGRQIPAELTWYDREMLIIGAWKNPDPVASEEELKGFDYMDKDRIAPVVALAIEFNSRNSATAQPETVV